MNAVTNTPLVPKEVSALVHHIELNRAGWSEKAVNRLVLAAIWLSDHSPTNDEIQATFQNTFQHSISTHKLSKALSNLEAQKILIKLPNNSWRIPHNQRDDFAREIAQAEQVAENARLFFMELVNEICPTMDSATLWLKFESRFLAPLISKVGATAYNLILGERLTADKKLVENFLSEFNSQFHSKLTDLITAFLNPKRNEVRAYVSRLLHAHFCIEASGLPDSVIQKLSASAGKQIEFRIFVDTNFLFSLLNLHENPSNVAAKELQHIINTLKSNLKIKLFVTPKTIEEAKTSIASAKGRLSGFPSSPNYTHAALSLNFSGMVEMFFQQRSQRPGLSAADWFDPYLTDFVTMARSHGVELHNHGLDAYSMRQDVVDDINLVIDSEKRLPPDRRKSYEKVAHDMILWHFVNDKRGAYVESPVDAGVWILTVDFRLINFDEQKKNLLNRNLPLCLHPTSLIQLLQFWVPRTKEFEEAVLSSLCLPFLFQEFDTEAEMTSLKILKGLGKFQGNNDLSVQTITQVTLNQGLRDRLVPDQAEEVELQLIRDALVDEIKARAEAEQERAESEATRAKLESQKAMQLQSIVDEKSGLIDALYLERSVREEEIQNLKTKVAIEEITNGKVKSQQSEIEDLKIQIQEINKANEAGKRRKEFALYLVLLVGILLLSGLSGWSLNKLSSKPAQYFGIWKSRILISSAIFALCHLLLEQAGHKYRYMTELWPFQKARNFRIWLWSVVFSGFVLGIFGNLYSNQIQKSLDESNANTSGPAKPVSNSIDSTKTR